MEFDETILKRYKAGFQALEEFDITGRLRMVHNKKKIDELLVLGYIAEHYQKEGVDYRKMLKDKELKKINIEKALDNLKWHFIVFEPIRYFIQFQPWFIKRLK